MAYMVLKRIPSQNELEIEIHSFFESFNENAVEPFIAKVEFDGEQVEIDGWLINKADWFSIIP